MNIINSISQIYVIVKKNIKRLLSSKISAAMVVFGPLILIMLMGLAFQGSGFNGVKVSIYSEQYNNISEKIIKTMEVSDFKIQRTKSKEECVEKVKDGEAHLCTTFPSNFEKDKMEFYVDYSRMNLVYAVVSKISAQITELSSQISMGITQDLLDFIKQSSNIMDQSSTSLTELKTNAEIMSIQLQVIKDTLDEINFDETTSTLKELTNEKSPTNLKIEIVKKQLELADQKLKQGKAELEEAEKTLETQTNSIKNTMTQMSCTSENSRDLTPYLKSQELQNQIISSPNPTCTLLNTIYINIKDEKNKATQSLEMLNNMELNIEMMKEEISKMQKIAISQANQTQTEIFDIQNNRDKLTNELFQMSNATNQSATSIQEMTTQLDIMISQFKEIASTDANTVIKPIKTSIKSLTAKKINTLEMLFPAIIIMVILFEGILLGNSLIMREKKSRAFFRNQILPISDFMFSIGTYITTIILTLIQVTIVIIIGLLIFKVNIIFQFFPLLTLIILSILIFSSIGMLIGYLTNSDETAILIAVILAIILMIFSNLVIPLETMQQTIGTIAQFTPFNISEQILRRSMIFGASLISSPIHTIAFVVELALLIIGVMFAHKKAFSQKN